MPRISRIPAGIVRCPWVFVPHPTTFAALVTTSEYCKPAVQATTGGRSHGTFVWPYWFAPHAMTLPSLLSASA